MQGDDRRNKTASVDISLNYTPPKAPTNPVISAEAAGVQTMVEHWLWQSVVEQALRYREELKKTFRVQGLDLPKNA